MDLIRQTIDAIRPPDEAAMARAREHQDRLTKPKGALGVLEELSVRLSGLAGECPPPIPEPVAVAVFAGDHGVHAQGVTPWPQEVTAQMVANFLTGGAVVNAFARQLGADVRVVDVGVRTPLDPHPDLSQRRVAAGPAAMTGGPPPTPHPGRQAPPPPPVPRRGAGGAPADMTVGPAMTPDQVRQALGAGVETARELVAAGHRCLITGDMGIANTTAAAALICALTGADPAVVTGRGTGIDDATLLRRPTSSGVRWPGTPRIRPTPSACSPRSAGSSTQRWPGSCSAPPRPGSRCCSTGSTPAPRRSSRRGPRPRPAGTSRPGAAPPHPGPPPPP